MMFPYWRDARDESLSVFAGHERVSPTAFQRKGDWDWVTAYSAGEAGAVNSLPL